MGSEISTSVDPPEINVDHLLLTIYEGIEDRKRNYKSDAYFDLPKDLTIDQIKHLQKTIESTDQTGCRLYARYRLQVWWSERPRRNTFEFLDNSLPIHDIDDQIKVFDTLQQN